MDIQRTQPSIVLPRVDIEDEKIKKILEEYNKILFELIPNIYSDIGSIIKKINDMES